VFMSSHEFLDSLFYEADSTASGLNRFNKGRALSSA